MNKDDFEYHIENLKLCDPDYVVDVLDITSEELIKAFPRKARQFIEEEFGCSESI